MANRYWINNGGDFSDTAHWSTSSGGSGGASVPGGGDNAIFDSNSFSSTGQTITLNSDTSLASMNWTGVTNTPTLASSNSYIVMYGNLTLVSGMNVTATNAWYFWSGSATITSAGKTLAWVNCGGGSGDSIILGDDLNVSGSLSHDQGTLNLNNKNVNTAYFTSNNSDTRTLTMGSGTISVSEDVDFSDTTNLTFNKGTGTLKMIGSGKTFYGGGLTWNNVEIQNGAEITGSNTFNDLKLIGSEWEYIFENGTTTTVTTLSGDGNSTYNVILTSASPGTTYTISKASGIVRRYYWSITDCVATGGATFFVDNSTLSNTTGWVTLIRRYWVGNSGTWSDTAHWSTTSGGTGGASVPGYDTLAIFDANSFNTGSQVVTIAAWAGCVDMDWTGVTNTPKLQDNASTGLDILCNLTFVSGMTTELNDWAYFCGGDGGNITSAGQSFGSVDFYGVSGTYNLQDDFTASKFMAIEDGVFNTNNHNINCYSFESSTTTARTLNLGSSTITVGWVTEVKNANLTLNAGTSTIIMNAVDASWRWFDGGGNTFYNVELHNSCGLAGNNTFNDLKISAGANIVVTAGSINTITSSSGDGTSDNNVILSSSSPGNTYTLSKTSGTLRVHYWNITDNIATGGATFIAVNSTLSNTTGWTLGYDQSIIASTSVSSSSIKDTTKIIEYGYDLNNAILKKVGKAFSLSTKYSAALSKKVGKVLSTSSKYSTTIAKKVGNIITSSINYGVNSVKNITNILSVNYSSQNTQTKETTKSFEYDYTTDSSILKKVLNVLSSSINYSTSIIKNVGIIIESTIVYSVVVAKFIKNILSFNYSIIDSLNKHTSKDYILNYSTSVNATKKTLKNIITSIGFTTYLIKLVKKIISSYLTYLTSINKADKKVLGTSYIPQASLVRKTSIESLITFVMNARITKRMSKAFSITYGIIIDVTKKMGKILNISFNLSSTILKHITKSLTSSLNYSVISSKFIKNILDFNYNIGASIVKFIMNLLEFMYDVESSLLKKTLKILDYSAKYSASLIKKAKSLITELFAPVIHFIDKAITKIFSDDEITKTFNDDDKE